jgi:catalase (peroxidase I)
MRYFDVLFGYEWELTTSPASAKQWQAVLVSHLAMLLIAPEFTK